MTRSRLLAAVLLLTSAASAQTFRSANGPWTRAHELVGSTPDGRIFARVGQRLGVTADGGRTWTVVSETAAPTRIAGTGAAIYGAFTDGVRLSRDGGATWTPFGLDGQNILDVAVDETVYALTDTAVYRLGDLAVWQPTTRPGASQSAYLRRLDAAGGTIAVAAVEPVCTGVYAQAVFYRSRDAGMTWSRSPGTGFPSDVAVAPDGTAYFATTSGEVCLGFVTPGGLFEQPPSVASAFQRAGGDRGGVVIDASGQPVSQPRLNEPGLNTFDLALSGDAVLFGTRSTGECGIDPPCSLVASSGLYVSTDTSVRPVGFEASDVRALARIGTTVAVPSDGAIYDLRGADLAFATPLAGVRAFVPLPGTPGTTLALATGPRADYDQGPVYSAAGVPLAVALGVNAPPYSPLSYVATVSADVVGDRILSVSKGFYSRPAVYVTDVTDSGFNSRAALEYGDLGSVGIVGTTVYAGAVDGLWRTFQTEPTPARIFRSDDRGDTWTPDDAGMTARDVFAFTAVGTGAARLDLAGTSGGVFARTPGAPWASAGLVGRRVLTFYDAPDGLLAGTDDGLFRRDAAGTWTRYGAGLDGRTVYAVLAAADAFGTWLGVGTDAGLFQTRAFGVAGEAAVPAGAGLRLTSRPNPSGGVRTVRLDGLDGAARVSVFDLLGRRVADLGTVTAQNAEAEWDASALPAGVYVVRATTESGQAVSVRAVVLR